MAAGVICVDDFGVRVGSPRDSLAALADVHTRQRDLRRLRRVDVTRDDRSLVHVCQPTHDPHSIRDRLI